MDTRYTITCSWYGTSEHERGVLPGSFPLLAEQAGAAWGQLCTGARRGQRRMGWPGNEDKAQVANCLTLAHRSIRPGISQSELWCYQSTERRAVSEPPVSLCTWVEKDPDPSRGQHNLVPFRGDGRGTTQVAHLQHRIRRLSQVISDTQGERSHFESRHSSFRASREEITAQRLCTASPKDPGRTLEFKQ